LVLSPFEASSTVVHWYQYLTNDQGPPRSLVPQLRLPDHPSPMGHREPTFLCWIRSFSRQKTPMKRAKNVRKFRTVCKSSSTSVKHRRLEASHSAEVFIGIQIARTQEKPHRL